MYKTFSYSMCVLMLVVLSGCVSGSRRPSIQHATITPADLKPGDVAVITIKINDHFGVVKSVEGIIKEDATIKFSLKDDGIDPDEEADDGIWSMKVEVPFNAPPGDFNFEAQAYDESHEIVVIRDENGDTAPLSTSFVVHINYPENQ